MSQDIGDSWVSIVAFIRDNSQFSVHTLKRLVDLEKPDAVRAWDAARSEMVDGPDMGIGVATFEARERSQFQWNPTSDELRPRHP